MVENNGYLRRRILMISLLLTLSASAAFAQTPSFTYQGRLSDGGTAASGTYDLQFTLFDSVSGGAQIGATQTVSTVAVSAGIFSVQLDFGAGAFPGANRFLEIGVRPAGGGAFTILSPRQPISSTPYAIRSLNASTADAVIVNGVPGGSGNYIQNATTPQPNANFNISGNGTAQGSFTALSYNTCQAGTGCTNVSRVLSTPGIFNVFVGPGTGQDLTSGGANTFVGNAAGLGTTEGIGNSFFGSGAGRVNTTGNSNTILGWVAELGSSNLTNATAIGARARVDQSNALVLGSIAGINSATSSVNVGIGTTTPAQSLEVNGITSLGAPGSVYGYLVGGSSPGPYPSLGFNAYYNSGAGYLAGVPGYGGIFQFQDGDGKFGYASTSSSVAAGAAHTFTNRLTISKDGDVGIGTTAPTAKLDLRVNSALIRLGGVDCGGNFGAITFGNVALGCSNYSLLGEGVNTFINRPSGGVITFRENNSEQMVIQSGGNVVINGRGEFGGLLKLDQIDSGFGAGTVQLCRNAANVIAVCASSSLRYKQQIVPFSGGLDLIRRLRPISFTWKMDGSRDLGLGAEDVAKVEPLLVTHNDKGEIEGVRYDRLNVVLVNAIKQQQDEISRQQNAIDLLTTTNADLSARLRVVERRLRPRARSARSVVRNGARREQ